MSKVYLLAVMGMIAAAASALAQDSMDQRWSGKGTMVTEDSGGPVPIDMTIHLVQTPGSLTIEDCWRAAGPEGQQCNVSHYDVDEASAIYQNGQKIGDIFPGHIQTFIGKAQVSEQMVFDINSRNQLGYEYNFATFDGTYQTRQGQLNP